MPIRNPLLKASPIVATESDPDVECRVGLAGSVVGYFRPDSIQDAKSNHYVRPVFGKRPAVRSQKK